MASYNAARVRQVNDRPVSASGRYVLYWMQMYRRLRHNHALDHARSLAVELKRPLVVYEGLRLDYPWSSARLHQFVLEGMADNAEQARQIGLNYWPFVETPDNPARGLLARLATDACAVITDDYPAFIAPGQTEALGRRATVRVGAVDGNCIIPLNALGSPATAAAHFRHRLHREFATAWQNRSAPDLELPPILRTPVEPPFAVWTRRDIPAFVASLPVDQAVRPITNLRGGSVAGAKLLDRFVRQRLRGYAELRSNPTAPDKGHASELSAHLHFGHISIEEIAGAVLGDWNPDRINLKFKGKRQGFFTDDADKNSFLDEALTWRDLGYHWHWHRRRDAASLETALPSWAWQTLTKHRCDPRSHLYSLEEFESAATHDELWNAAQKELVATGRIQNYLRMLWGKKVIEWSESPEEAYRILEHLNNKYAVDGRDPNSYTGILWCFGLFDRPWPPERPVFGTVRFMSSENTARKFKMGSYLDYVRSLKD
jgi:deoxyribodipyrimidine photo-lyase